MSGLAKLQFIIAVIFAQIFIQAVVGECRTLTPLSISIVIPPHLSHDSVVGSAVEDARVLLKQAFPAADVSLNNCRARVQLILDEKCRTTRIVQVIKGAHPVLTCPAQNYRWRSAREGDKILIHAEFSSPNGASSALYGLLQEKLGFRFYHPRRTLIPTHRQWPLPDRFTWEAVPRFDKRGFHVHTLHPTELTEQLHNPSYPTAQADVRAYIDWLARNGQNVMQFYLLRDVDRVRWIPHARTLVDYAHRRGIKMGVEVSLCMLQQKAFQIFKPLRPVFYRHQVDKSLAWLFQVPWDFVTVEFTLGEYLPDLGGILTGLKGYLEQEIVGRYRTPVMAATHVIRSSEERAGVVGGKIQPDDGFCAGRGAQCGVLIHTVMCYSATEQNAPVYGNRNQRFMLERAINEAKKRETWYWPESSYWVAFDNSVPLMLLPYLDARWRDMAVMEESGVNGHLTFSSGWEWGYWLTDWSIARWSWRYSESGRPIYDGHLGGLTLLFPDQRLQRLWDEAFQLQNHYLKERELLRYLAALAPFSELPPPFDQPFQPAPDFTNEWLLRKASGKDVDALIKGPITDLEEYAAQMTILAERLETTADRLLKKQGDELQGISRELTRGLRMTALRARHRALTLRALVAQRDAKYVWQPASKAAGAYLAAASRVRNQALAVVSDQEQIYRYPVEAIARRRPDLTAYGFGYLYPVSDLFFWQREEEQVRLLRFDALFMNIWNFRRTVGLESLLL